MPEFMAHGETFLIHRCWNCDVAYAMTTRMEARRREDGEGFFCPNGHRAVFGETTSETLRRERDRLKQQMARLEDEKREAEVRADAAERSAKRMRRRAAAGTCPCCKRTFSSVASHIRQKHPEFVCESGIVVPLKRKAQP